MNRYSLILLVLIGFFLSSCKKGHRMDCFKSAGKEETVFVELQNFSKLDVDGKAIVELVYRPGFNPKAEITYNENLIRGIQLENKDGILRIRETNTCNWVRKSGLRPRIKLFVNDLFYEVRMDGISELYNQDTLRMRNLVLTNHGMGSVDLTIWGVYGMECNGFNSGKFKIKGFVGYIASTIDDISSLDTRGLLLNDLYLFNYSLNPSYVGSNTVMQIKNAGRGDIFIHEYPSVPSLPRCCVFELKQLGKGRIIYQ